MADSPAKKMDEFFDSFQTLPGLIRSLALSVAEAQTALDRNYIENLGRFAKIVGAAIKDKPTSDEFKSLFASIAPSRYQFSETVVEVRADLQATSSSQLSVNAGVGVSAGVFALTVNASYAKRSGYDYRAAARVRTVLNALPADPSLLDKLLKEHEAIQLPEKDNSGQDALTEAITKTLPDIEVPKKPA